MDWNSLGLGAILTQKNDSSWEYVVAYALRNNNLSEANYLSYEGETMAAVCTIDHFQPYLYNQRFILVTLWWLMKLDKFTKKFAIWVFML